MADDLTITAGTGTTIRAVEKSSKKSQVVVLDLGGAGAESLLTTTLPVSLATNTPTLAAGTNTIGTVRGNGNSVQVTLTVTNGVYTIADVVGGLITFAGAVSAVGKLAIINSIKLAGVAAIPYELWFFVTDIATPASDNEVFTLVVADTENCLGVVSIAGGDYNAAASAFNVATLRGVGLQVKAAPAATSIYAYLKATAVTSPGTTTIYLTVDFEYLS